MQTDNWIVLVILSAGVWLSVAGRKLTIPAALTGGVIGWTIFLGAGFPGLAMLGTFFVLGTLATSWQLPYKIESGLAEVNKGRRTTGQVWANGGVAGLTGIAAWLWPQHAEICRFMMAGSLAAATADTLSSELGNVYGRKFYHILTFKPDRRGLDGVVSLEGTLIGMLGSLIIALIYAAGFSRSWWAGWIVAAGTIGNFSDSILGAALERKHYLSNNAVNFLNTLMGALTALLLFYMP